MNNRSYGVVAPTLIGALLSFAAAAQEANQEIFIVSATRNPALLSEEPISITALRGEQLTGGLPVHPAEVLNQAPGTFVQAGSGQEHLTAIRSPVLTGGAGAGSFLYLQDGVPLRSAGFANVNGLFDAGLPYAEQVEIVRGPGDVAYGSNAVHGAVNIISHDPLSAEGGYIRAQIGEFERYGGTATYGARKGAHGVFAAFHGVSDGGYRAESGVDQYKAQLAHGVELGDFKIRTRLNGHILHQETAGFVEGTDAFADDALRRSNPNPEAFRDAEHVSIATSIIWGRENWSFHVAPYLMHADMRFRQHFLPSQAIEENSHTAFGLLTSGEGQLSENTSLLVGVDTEYASGALLQVQERPTIFSFVQGVHFDYEVDAISVAPFIRLHHRLSDKLSVQGGARLTYTHYDYDNRLDDEPERFGRFIRAADRSDNFTAATAKIAAFYQLSPNFDLYGSLARSARPPQTTDLYRLQINQEIGKGEVENLNMAEFGARITFDSFSGSIAAFTGRKKNFLFRDADGFTVDDGKTTHKGVEFDFTWAPRRDLRLFVSGTLAEHQYDFDRVVGRASEVIVAGNEVDTAPTTLGRTGFNWTPLAQLSVSGQVSHVGAYFTDAANTNDYGGHNVIDICAAYNVSDHIQLRLVGKNITDKRYATRADFAFGDERYFPGEERHLVANVTITY